MAGIRAQKKQQTRQKLKNAAISLFIEAPITTVGPPDIAKAAGVAQGTFYVHFADRNALVDDLVKELNEGLNQAFIETLTPMVNDSVTDGLHALAKVLIDYHYKHRELLPLYLDHITRGGRERITGTNTVMHTSLVDVLRRVPEVEPTPLRADLVSHALLALWRQIAFRNVREGEDIEELITTLVESTRGIVNTIAPNIMTMKISHLAEIMMSDPDD